MAPRERTRRPTPRCARGLHDGRADRLDIATQPSGPGAAPTLEHSLGDLAPRMEKQRARRDPRHAHRTVARARGSRVGVLPVSREEWTRRPAVAERLRPNRRVPRGTILHRRARRRPSTSRRFLLRARHLDLRVRRTLRLRTVVGVCHRGGGLRRSRLGRLRRYRARREPQPARAAGRSHTGAHRRGRHPLRSGRGATVHR